jgi:hypothetical protein
VQETVRVPFSPPDRETGAPNWGNRRFQGRIGAGQPIHQFGAESW